MEKIVLISCVSKKLKKKSKAKDLYISPLFKFNFSYAQSLNPDEIFILSAEHGLLNPEKEIEPYDKTLNDMGSKEIKQWSNKVIAELKKVSDVKNDKFIFLAGERYRKFLISEIKNYEIPLKGLSIGKQLQFLKQRLK